MNVPSLVALIVLIPQQAEMLTTPFTVYRDALPRSTEYNYQSYVTLLIWYVCISLELQLLQQLYSSSTSSSVKQAWFWSSKE